MSADLVRDLARLGDELDWPATPDLAAGVEERLRAAAAAPARGQRAARRQRRRRRRLVVALALALLVPAAAAVAFPSARDEVLEWLGLKSVEVRRAPQLPAGARAPSRSELGALVTLEEAAVRAGFRPVTPPRLGRPREVRERGGVVTLVYDRVRLAQLPGALDRMLVRKTVDGRAGVRVVPEGLFVEGRHAYLYLDPEKRIRTAETRLAGTTLLVERGDLLLRLEGDLTYAEARALISRSG